MSLTTKTQQIIVLPEGVAVLPNDVKNGTIMREQVIYPGKTSVHKRPVFSESPEEREHYMVLRAHARLHGMYPYIHLGLNDA